MRDIDVRRVRALSEARIELQINALLFTTAATRSTAHAPAPARCRPSVAVYPQEEGWTRTTSRCRRISKALARRRARLTRR
jgi:hypothetical protein